MTSLADPHKVNPPRSKHSIPRATVSGVLHFSFFFFFTLLFKKDSFFWWWWWWSICKALTVLECWAMAESKARQYIVSLWVMCARPKRRRRRRHPSVSGLKARGSRPVSSCLFFSFFLVLVLLLLHAELVQSRGSSHSSYEKGIEREREKERKK